MMVYKPPPKRKIAYEIMTAEVMNVEGLDVEILRNHRLIEKDIDDARFLIFCDISCSLVGNQVFRYLFSPFSC